MACFVFCCDLEASPWCSGSQVYSRRKAVIFSPVIIRCMFLADNTTKYGDLDRDAKLGVDIDEDVRICKIVIR